ncbi:MAG: DNA/RNA helicase domain-containing protein [Patescibacteria group bacterium]
MAKIYSLPFKPESFQRWREYYFGTNWPVVYVSENGKEVYIGQTVHLLSRCKQHYENVEKRKLSTMHVISDEEFNVSATLDIESWLIQYMSGDGRFILQNGNGGMKDHNYYDKERYKTKFELAWEKLREMELATHTMAEIKNGDLFKYSPYKSLTEDQMSVAHSIVEDLEQQKSHTYIVNGKPGTGKTILAIYLFKYLQENEKTQHLNVGLVVPMMSLRKTVQKVFRHVKGLKSSMVIGPADATRGGYDLLIVDEAHRLRRRKNITNYAAFDAINKQLNLPEDATELNWILQSSRAHVLFYDQNQSIKPSDVRAEDFDAIHTDYFELSTQVRVKGGTEYIDFIEHLFNRQVPTTRKFGEYEFRLYEDIRPFLNDIKQREIEHGLCRVVAGYAWPWNTKKGKDEQAQDYDIEIDGIKLVWNSTSHDWVNSPNAINEVGCIHTIQGYDLNYVGVIIGPELSYDSENKTFVVNKELYFDTKGHAGIQDPAELKRYIINIYKTLLTRGIHGTYIYIVDDGLRNYFKKYLGIVADV